MAKKIMILASSPNQHGNTNTVVEWFARAATKAGAQVTIIDTAHLKYASNGCTACMGCQKSEKFECVIKDQASPIIATIPDYDVLVWATPIYYMGFNAQLKLFIDRMLSLIKFDLETGDMTFARTTCQTQVFIATAGGGLEDSGIKIAEQTAQMAAEFHSYPFHSLLVPNAPMDSSEMKNNTEVKQKAQALGKKIATE